LIGEKMTNRDLIFNLIKDAIKTEDKSKRILFANLEYMLSETRLNEIKTYLEKISPEHQEKIYLIIKEFNPSQLSLFFENIKHNMKLSKAPSELFQDARDIKKGLFPRKLIFDKRYISGCPSTYLGFMRALKSGTLYTAKIKINGKLKRVFIKTPIGQEEVDNFHAGFNKLLIDPETMDVYYFTMDEKGKIKDDSLVKMYSEKLLNKNRDKIDPFVKSFYDFKKELLKYVDKVYGLERIAKTYTNFGGQIDPEKKKEIEALIGSEREPNSSKVIKKSPKLAQNRRL